MLLQLSGFFTLTLLCSINRKKKGETLTEKWRDLQMKIIHKHKHTEKKGKTLTKKMKRSPDGSHTQTHENFDIFWQSQRPFSIRSKLWSRKVSVIAEVCHSSFHVFVCNFHPNISSFFSESFPFLFLFIVLSVLRYLPFHFHVQLHKQCIKKEERVRHLPGYCP